jgi:hypothetical protein
MGDIMHAMKLTFTTTVEDWLAFTKHVLLKDSRYRDGVFVYQWFYAIAAGALAAYVFADVSREVGIGAGVVALALVATTFPRMARASALRSSLQEMSRQKYRPLYNSERVLELSVAGIRSESPATTQFVRWEFVEAVHETDTHAFISFPGRSGLVIPKSVVEKSAFATFLSEVKVRIAHAKPTVGGPGR